MRNQKDLLFSVTKKDLIIQTFKSGGKGGQHQNKVDSGVRIIHKESGAVGESRTARSQYANKKLAFRLLIKNPKFKIWMNQRVQEEFSGRTIAEEVNELMNVKNLKIEVLNEDKKWIVIE